MCLSVLPMCFFCLLLTLPFTSPMVEFQKSKVVVCMCIYIYIYIYIYICIYIYVYIIIIHCNFFYKFGYIFFSLFWQITLLIEQIMEGMKQPRYNICIYLNVTVKCLYCYHTLTKNSKSFFK
jgi:hypothetical protein